MVIDQLRCNGTLEAVQVMQKAYPSRIDYKLIYTRVVNLLPPFMQQMRPAGLGCASPELHGRRMSRARAQNVTSAAHLDSRSTHALLTLGS